MAGPSVLDSQVKAFREALTLWTAEHALEAMDRGELEDLLRVGVFLYEQTDARDRRWRLAMARGTRKHDRAAERRIEEAFAWWLRPCRAIEARIRRLEAGGSRVENADKFRRYHRLALAAAKDRDAESE